MKLSWRSILHRVWILVSLGLALAASAPAQNQIFDSRTLAPYVPTPQVVVEEMLELAEVGPSDVVYDLGSGDGRILIAAAKSFRAQAVGIEIDPKLVRETRSRISSLGLSSKVKVLEKNMLNADLSAATVVTVYLMTSSNEQLKPKLEQELARGARVVSHDFQFLGWKPAAVREINADAGAHKIYLYRIGAHREDQDPAQPQ